MSLDKSTYSLAILQGIETIQNTFEELEKKYEDLVERIPFNPKRDWQAAFAEDFSLAFCISYIPVNKSLKFNFDIYAIKDSKWTGISYFLAYQPRNKSDIKEFKGSASLNEAVEIFKKWVDIVLGYNKVTLSKEEIFLNDSTEQFYEEFKIVDKDANENPFDNDKQVLFYKLLEFFKHKIENSPQSNDTKAKEIIEEINTLQDSIINTPKAKVIKEFAKIVAKIKALSLKLFIDIFDVAKKEIIKKALYGGMDEMNKIIHHLL